MVATVSGTKWPRGTCHSFSGQCAAAIPASHVNHQRTAFCRPSGLGKSDRPAPEMKMPVHISLVLSVWCTVGPTDRGADRCCRSEPPPPTTAVSRICAATAALRLSECRPNAPSRVPLGCQVHRTVRTATRSTERPTAAGRCEFVRLKLAVASPPGIAVIV